MATYTNLNNEIFAQAALEAFTKTLLPFMAFSTNFSPAPVARGDTVLVPLISGLTATTFGGSYSICAGTKSVVTITINRHKHVPIGQSDLDAANSSEASLESFGRQQGIALAVAVLQDVFTLVTTANFALATAVASTAMDIPQMRRARLLLNQNDVAAQPRSLLLDCVPYDALLGVTNFVQSQLAQTDETLRLGIVGRAMGFNLYELNSLFVSGASVMGFAAHPAAIAIAMRYLKPQDGNTYRDARPMADPTTGAVLGIRDHYDNAAGARFINLECNYGFAVGLTTAARVIKQTD